MAIWTMTVPVISTAHIKKETADKLGFGEASGYCVFPLCDGYMLYVGDVTEAEDNTFEEEDLAAVAKWAHENGSNGWVRIDSSGDTYDLPQYDW